LVGVFCMKCLTVRYLWAKKAPLTFDLRSIKDGIKGGQPHPGFGRSPLGLPKSLGSNILSLQTDAGEDSKHDNQQSQGSPREQHTM
jgi:hypothetical protein